MPTGVAKTCCLEIEFTLKPGKRREFARSFEDLICHEGEGHIKSTVFEDRDEPGHMIWIGAWSSRSALEAYMHSRQFRVLIGGLKVLSSQANCRVVDEGCSHESPEPLLRGQNLKESRLIPIDLEKFEGPTN